MPDPKPPGVEHLLEEEAERQAIYAELRKRGFAVQPHESTREARLAAAMSAAKVRERRIGGLAAWLVDQMEKAQAAFIVHDVAERGGVDALPSDQVGEFMKAWESYKRPGLAQPELLPPPTAGEVEEAYWRANSVFNARLLAPVRIAGIQTETIVVDVLAQARYQAIYRAWALPLVALAVGATAGYAGTLLQPAAAGAGTLPGFVPIAGASPMLSAAAPPLVSFSLPTFLGWGSQSFVDPVAQLVFGTEPLMPANSKLEEAKAQLANAAFALGGSVGGVFGMYFLVEFLSSLGETVDALRSRMSEGQ